MSWNSPRSGAWQGSRTSTYLTPAEKLTTGKKSPSRLKASKTPCTGQPLMRKEMDGTLRSRQQLTTSSGARRCCPGEVTGRATCPAPESPGRGQKSEVPRPHWSETIGLKRQEANIRGSYGIYILATLRSSVPMEGPGAQRLVRKSRFP